MITILPGDCRDVLKTLPSGSVHMCVTSPPYFGLRDYDIDGQIGLEMTPAEFVAELVAVFREMRRVLRDDGTFWLNLGDCYTPENRGENATPRKEFARNMQGNHFHSDQPTRKAQIQGMKAEGFKRKDRLMIPARVALALCSDGWWLRDEIVWHKPNPMPTSVKDRTTPAHEMIYMFSKQQIYFYDIESIKEPAVSTHSSGNGFSRPQQLTRGGRGKKEQWTPTATRQPRSVWSIPVRAFAPAHFATFPPDLVEPCILAGCPIGGIVLDPFFGAGTTGLVAAQHGRHCIGIELNSTYVAIAQKRLGLPVDLPAKTYNLLTQPALAAAIKGDKMPKVIVTLEFDTFDQAQAFFAAHQGSTQVPSTAVPLAGSKQQETSGAAAATGTAAASPQATAGTGAGAAATGSSDAAAGPTLEDVKAAMYAYVAKGEGRSAATAKNILQQHGISTTYKDAKPEQYQVLINAFKTA